MKKWWLFVLGVIFGLLSAALIMLASQTPRSIEIAFLPPPTPIPIQIHVSGAVTNPGVFALPPGNRLLDAILAAGELTSQADPSGLNLAAFLEDSLRVQVPAQVSMATPAPTQENNSPAPQNPSEPVSVSFLASTALININTASQTEWQTLSGIGPATALRSIALRQENDLFLSIEEIQKVSGIGLATFENIKDFITVDDQV